MNKCKCGAISRTTHPFGNNSKSRISFIRPHNKDCKHNK